MKIVKLVLVTAILAAVTSCNKDECINANPMLSSGKPDTETYKKELLKEIKAAENVSITLSGYQEENGVPQLSVDIYGDKLCAKAVIAVTKPDHIIANVIANKGKGYEHTLLENLNFSLDPISNDFIYDGVDEILD